MKSALDYRGARRNAARTSYTQVHETTWIKSIKLWRERKLWHHANIAAKIGERRKMVREAIMTLAKAMASSPRTFTSYDIIKVLREFYLKQRRTRVISRILDTELRLTKPD